jgi:hypothetical protein
MYAFFVALFVVCVAAGARGDAGEREALEARARSGDADEASAALYALAELDDQAGDYARALERYRASVARLPSHRFALRATARADTLAAHAEGDFLPFAKLERVRRDPKLSNDARAIEALARDAESFPPGPVRVEARMLVAEAYLGRLGRRDEGLAMLQRVVDDASCDPVTRRFATRRAVEVLLARDDVAGAQAWTARGGADAEISAMVRARARRGWAHRAALATLASLVLLAAAALLRARARGVSAAASVRMALPSALLFAAFVGGAGGALASAYEAGNARPFLVFAAASVPVLLLARAWAYAAPARLAARLARAGLCAAAVVAVGFLVLEYVDTDYLRGFGL